MKTKEILGKVIKLFIANSDSRTMESTIQVDENGIVKDKYYKKNINRAILVSSIHSYELVKNNNIDIEYGSLKENIIFDFDINILNIGDRITIGEVVLEISENCTICEQLKTINDKVPEILRNDRGVFVKVISSGYISLEDVVSCIKFKGN